MSESPKIAPLDILDLYDEHISVLFESSYGEYADKEGIRYVYPGVKAEEVDFERMD